MDNSFFCLRSYNQHPITHSECLICLNNPTNALSQCNPFPVNYQRETNIEYLENLIKLSKRIFFLAQNENQKKLLHMHFGNDINCAVVGLDTGELNVQSNILNDKELNCGRYDLVYHGGNHLAKGIPTFQKTVHLIISLTVVF